MGLPYTTYIGCLIAAFPNRWLDVIFLSLCGSVVMCRGRCGTSRAPSTSVLGPRSGLDLLQLELLEWLALSPPGCCPQDNLSVPNCSLASQSAPRRMWRKLSLSLLLSFRNLFQRHDPRLDRFSCFKKTHPPTPEYFSTTPLSCFLSTTMFARR